MDYAPQSRIHPLMAGAAASVILVSLVGVAAITGIIPASHSSVAPTASSSQAQLAVGGNAQAVTPISVTTKRYVTPDGKVLEVVSSASELAAPTQKTPRVQVEHLYAEPAPVPRKVVHHYVPSHQQPQNAQTHYQTTETYARPVYQQQYSQSPTQSYISSMNPVGTGVGAVVGGLLGHQVGGGNGKTLATVAGAVLGGYAGNEVAHNRSPLPW